MKNVINANAMNGAGINGAIKQYMNDRGIKYSHVAEKVQIPHNIFSNIIHGRRNVKAEELFRICDILGITADELRNYNGMYAAGKLPMTKETA